jgi:hypothetical protein
VAARSIFRYYTGVVQAAFREELASFARENYDAVHPRCGERPESIKSIFGGLGLFLITKNSVCLPWEPVIYANDTQAMQCRKSDRFTYNGP